MGEYISRERGMGFPPQAGSVPTKLKRETAYKKTITVLLHTT